MQHQHQGLGTECCAQGLEMRACSHAAVAMSCCRAQASAYRNALKQQ
jgi:hypothetical protein